ncbi:LemA protein [Kitasatospora sp. MAP12-15]|uniref:LemA family protein n=1 Tax=unclassified Kitasatospora TaxID=2633591 RepID=UPI0024734F82|nr:LemA family protein [Kitasatospora sp. MAP12-44]MDH6110289.1 LemA protein [Kitasatospora sp. MAP12-44]
MDAMSVIVIVGTAVLALALGWGVVRAYNRLIRLRNQTQASWAQIDVQLKRRHDLIPNLVETVTEYADHERGTFEAVTAARGAAASGGLGTAQRAQAEGQLTATLAKLLATAEAYPQLKADRNFLRLQSELTGAEDRIAYARQFYNAAVQSYNTALETFPSNLVAGLASHAPKEYFEAEAATREAVQVSFR